MSDNSKPDQSFDSIANKFQHNIYGSSKGRLRHELWLHYLDSQLDFTRPLSVLDAGGGTGMMTEALLQRGCQVCLNDVSAESLQIARQRLGDNPAVTFQHGPLQELKTEQGWDLIVCHAVLEWLQQPMDVVAQLSESLAPGGYMSLSFFNRDAQQFGNILYGNFDYVKQGMHKRNTVRLNPNNPLSPKQVLHALEAMPVDVVKMAGIRCFHDYLIDRSIQEPRYDEIKDMELAYGDKEPYLWLGKYFYLLLRKA